MKKIIFIILFILITYRCYGSIKFDDIDDFFSVSDSSSIQGISDFGTLSFWYKPDTSSGGGTRYELMEFPVDVNNFFRLELFSDNNWYIGFRDGGTFYRAIIAETAMSLTAGTWYHILVTWDDTANEIRVYLDGSETGNKTDALVTPTLTGGLQFGRYQPSSPSYSDGTIDEISIFDKVLDSRERNIIPSSKRKRMVLQTSFSSSVVYLPLDSLPNDSSADAKTLIDLSGNGNNATGDDGANNTGLTAKSGILTYPD